MRAGWMAAVLAGVLLVGGVARAETAEDECQRLSDEAVDAYKAANYQKAVELLSRAYAIRPLTPLLYNLAKGYDKLNDADKAYESYKKFVDTGEADAKLEAKARARMAFFEPQLKPKEQPKPEKPPEEEVVKPKGPTAEELEEQEHAKTRRLKLYTIIGGGVLAIAGIGMIIGGGATYSSASKKYDAFKIALEESSKRQLRNDGESLGTTSTALYAVGSVVLVLGAAAVAAAFFLPMLQAPDEEKKPLKEDEKPPEVTVVPWIGPNVAGAGAIWIF
ncbi:MAG: hypothetical protein EXR72_21935 [Myxococcales bacterium]|nr:hypothetical protein [Myxococcales bacterium]